jgi:hypothetical protein
VPGRIDPSYLREDLERLGYNNLGLNIGLEGLIAQRMIFAVSIKNTIIVIPIQRPGIAWSPHEAHERASPYRWMTRFRFDRLI